MRSISAEELSKITALNGRIIDIRENFEYSKGHVPNAINIPMSELMERMAEVNHGDYIICQSGERSMNACTLFDLLGIDVINVEDGTDAFPLELKK
ncbi:rhodanese-like domain-containing protein [Lactococcus fujiensis]|uniref:Rhodanese-related sulfurtransferase n=1 Tax=Lactococcus fujiensis JCM 16395 TaxID=1291764 RepID=A0A2A5RNW8_9LACT|nr:rhodanese-like domain-containing protein [Lactococcus fujiensis]PCS01062.1 rhodanese-related sulfurtransferase [Lactococcus fujiensis JCM 16395]